MSPSVSDTFRLDVSECFVAVVDVLYASKVFSISLKPVSLLTGDLFHGVLASV